MVSRIFCLIICVQIHCDESVDATAITVNCIYLYPTSGAAVGILLLGFPHETSRAAPEGPKTSRGIVLVFPHETPRTGLTALTGRGISNYGQLLGFPNETPRDPVSAGCNYRLFMFVSVSLIVFLWI